jgi:Ni/Co efflux regulator RcnB
MMKPLMIGVLSLATLAAPMAASAQSWGYGDRDRDGRYERWERREDRQDRRAYRRWERQQDRAERRWERQQRREYRRWARGQTIPHQYRSSWYVRDYHRYGWAPPPRGYGYYRTDSGDVVMAAIATGVILSLLND